MTDKPQGNEYERALARGNRWEDWPLSTPPASQPAVTLDRETYNLVTEALAGLLFGNRFAADKGYKARSLLRAADKPAAHEHEMLGEGLTTTDAAKIAKAAHAEDASTGEWRCWCETCCLVRAIMADE